MAKFQRGDIVLVNGNMVATIHTYDEDAGRLVLSEGTELDDAHLIYGPIGTYRLQHLVSPAIGRDPEPEADEAEAAQDEDAQPADEFTTLESL